MDTADALGVREQYASQPTNHVALNLPSTSSLYLGESMVTSKHVPTKSLSLGFRAARLRAERRTRVSGHHHSLLSPSEHGSAALTLPLFSQTLAMIQVNRNSLTVLCYLPTKEKEYVSR